MISKGKDDALFVRRADRLINLISMAIAMSATQNPFPSLFN
jgi:hypothetical protein